MNKKKMHKFYKLNISFFGKNFLGWQKQRDFFPTVQGELEKSIEKVFKTDNFKTIASGRTDAGVHAKSLIVKLKAPFAIETEGLKRAINTSLDLDIRVLDVQECEDFNPTFDAKERSYFYLLTDRKSLSPFEKDFITAFSKEIDIKLLNEALICFVGKHDFVNYMCTGSEVKSTIREIYKISVTFVEGSFHGLIGNHIRIDIHGSGFLKQMIRLIVSVATSYAQKKITLKDIEKSLSERQKFKLAPVAPARGLYKASVSY